MANGNTDGNADAGNQLVLEVSALLKSIGIAPGVAEKAAETIGLKAGEIFGKAAADTVQKEMTSGEAGRTIFAKMFPQLGLKLDEKTGKYSTESLLNAGSTVAGGTADGLIKVIQTGFGIIQDIYKQLVKSSPLLEAVQSLFDLAMQLFFMPLGNKLAEELIPAALEMIDDVMEMWDSMEGKSLEDILTITLNKFSDIFIGFIENIGDQLATHGGLIGSIGRLLQRVGALMDNVLPRLIDFSVWLMGVLMDWFPTLIGLIIGFKLAMVELMIAQIVATSLPDKAKWAAGIGIAAAAVSIAGSVGAANIMMADGGYVAATPGGTARILGEAGEGEWVVPESKVSNFITQQSSSRNLTVGGRSGNGDTYVINVYGYTDSELGGIIENKVNEMSNRSRLRSGY